MRVIILFIRILVVGANYLLNIELISKINPLGNYIFLYEKKPSCISKDRSQILASDWS